MTAFRLEKQLQTNDPIGKLVEIHFVPQQEWALALSRLPFAIRSLAEIEGASRATNSVRLLPSDDGKLGSILVGLVHPADKLMALRGLARRLPPGDYRLAEPVDNPDVAASYWAAGMYRFERYKTERTLVNDPVRLLPLSERASAMNAGCALARDLINTPANNMGPRELEAAVAAVAASHCANVETTVGDALLERGYPAIHAVGRAANSDRAPRLVEMSWGDPDKPHVTVIGKGVTFDTGGLDLKSSAGMRLMKKDMAGAAHALALASMTMTMKLPIRLTVLLPIVENAVSGNAMRPGDVLSTRKQLTVEVGNTDAEGRLILADALTRAAELKPELTIDLATLTGAARVALGPEIAPYYTADDRLAADLDIASNAEQDPIWRMPLWSGYAAALESDIADLKNDPDDWAQAGSVMAALFLQRFAPSSPWVHFDIFGWNPRSRPGWPKGAETQAVRAIFAMLERRYASAA